MTTVNVLPVPVTIAVKAVEEIYKLWLSALMPSLFLETAPDGEGRVRCQVHAGGARHDDA